MNREGEDKQQNISWVSDEFKHHNRDMGWYAGLFLLSMVLIAWGLYANNLIATILFLIILFTVYALSHKQPKKTVVQVDHKGVKLNETFYPYAGLKRFWLLRHDDGELELTFESKSMLNRHLSVQLEGQNPEEIRNFLHDYLEEAHDYEENFIDYLARKLKL